MAEAPDAARVSWWRLILREIAVTVDVLLGGDLRRHTHDAPAPCDPPTMPPPKPADSRGRHA